MCNSNQTCILCWTGCKSLASNMFGSHLSIYYLLLLLQSFRSSRPIDAIYSVVREMADPDAVRYVQCN